ncbi:14050_t:CDS:2 [Racocetra fulgida]|uniref:14050_t:CDS:1 n=1 Tax=Racocetra fulgida TaxID=60492 RepID=A0A9N9H0G5_9GLOM|nr:14050_t:CDS:2 [Racocetra fulgida]
MQQLLLNHRESSLSEHMQQLLLNHLESLLSDDYSQQVSQHMQQFSLDYLESSLSEDIFISDLQGFLDNSMQQQDSFIFDVQTMDTIRNDVSYINISEANKDSDHLKIVPGSVFHNIKYYTSKGLNMCMQLSILEDKYPGILFLSQDLFLTIQSFKQRNKVNNEASILLEKLLNNKAQDLNWVVH